MNEKININWGIQKLKENLFTIIFVMITFGALIYRISLHADIYDEIINLNVAYRVALGNIPFYECWETFQSGDILIAPFLWIYTTFFKTTSGLILYSRILYLLAYSYLGIIVYNVFKHCVSKKQAFYIGYMCIFFEIYSLYYLWYDTISVLLFSIATILLFYALSIRYDNKYVYFAGIATGCMAFSYPSMIIIALLMVVLILLYAVRYNNKKSIIMFIFGGFSVLVLFGLYVWKIIGISNFISGLKVILSYRTVSVGGSTYSHQLFYLAYIF